MSSASQGDPRPPKRSRLPDRDEARAPVPPTFFFASRQRGPPPAACAWPPPLFDLDYQNLPPLPAIRTEALAQQAVTSKQWLGSVAGRPHRFTYDDELASYRRLEYLGDAVLYPALAKQLFRLFPNAGSGVLSTLRSELHGNSTQSHLAWAYELDLRLRVPENPNDLKALRRPLHQNANVIAALFEAHLGALAEEDREAEIAGWVAGLLERNMAKLRQRVADLLDRTRAIDRSFKRPEPNADAKKEGVFDGERGKDAASTARPKCILEECPARPAIESCKPEYEDHLQHGGNWHTHLIFGDTTLGCGVGTKRHHAQKAALEEFFHLIAAETELLPFVERAAAARRALGDARGELARTTHSSRKAPTAVDAVPYRQFA